MTDTRQTNNSGQSPPYNPVSPTLPIYARTQQFDVVAGGYMRRALYDAYATYTVRPGPMTVKIDRKSATQYAHNGDRLDPYEATATIAMQAAYDHAQKYKSFADALGAFTADAFNILNTANGTLEGNSSVFAKRQIERAPDQARAAALAVSSYLTGLALHTLLKRAYPRLPQQAITAGGVRLDVEQVHATLFFTHTSEQHEQHLVEALQRVSQRLLLRMDASDLAPFVRGLARATEHICKLHDARVAATQQAKPKGSK